MQAAWLLLYYCAVPRLNHLLRTLPPRLVQPLAEAHDTSIMEVFAQLFNIPPKTTWNTTTHGIPYDTWLMQAQLPIRFGGMGLRHSGETAYAAYWASWADVLPSLIISGRPMFVGNRCET